MEIQGIGSNSIFDTNSFLEKTKNKNALSNTFSNDDKEQSNGSLDINASGFLDKASGYDKMGQSDDKLDERLNNVLAMAMAGQDISGLLEGVQQITALEAAEATLDEINADIEQKAQEAIREETAIEEHISDEAQIAINSDAQVSVDADGQAPTNTEGQAPTNTEGQVAPKIEAQVSTGSNEQPASDSSNTSESTTNAAKPTKESVDLYV